MKARSQKVSTVSLVPPRVNTADPDIDEIHEMIALAIDRAEGDAPPPETAKKGRKKQRSAGTTGGSIGSLAEGYAANQASDLGATC
jgi:hypothetical protein